MARASDGPKEIWSTKWPSMTSRWMHVDAVRGEGAQLGFQVEKIRGQDGGEKRVHLLTWMPIRFLALISNPGDGNCLRMMPGFSPK